LGCKNGSKVSRYENLLRHPSPEAIFAYEVIFRSPARDLFAGIYQEVEKRTVRRAKLLARKLPADNPDTVTSRKLQALRAISGPETQPKKQS